MTIPPTLAMVIRFEILDNYATVARNAASWNLFPDFHQLKCFYEALGMAAPRFLRLQLSHNNLLVPFVDIRPSIALSLPYFSYSVSLTVPEYHDLKSSELAASLMQAGYNSFQVRIAVSGDGIPDVNLPKKVLSVLDLAGSWDDILGNMQSRMRSKFRKAQRENFKLVTDSSNFTLNEFCRLYTDDMHTIGSPALNKHFFRDFLSAFSSARLDLCLSSDDQPRAGAISLVNDTYAENLWFCSTRPKGGVSPAVALYALLMNALKKQGIVSFSLGRSTFDSGTHELKRRLGGTDLYLGWWDLVRNRSVFDDPSLVDRWRPALSAFWKAVPEMLKRPFSGYLARRYY